MNANECLFCRARKCYVRIHRDESPQYDHVACRDHSRDLETHADKTLGKNNGVMRSHVSSSSPLKRATP